MSILFEGFKLFLKILKVAWQALQELEIEGKIRIYTPEQVAEIIRQNPKKKINKQANNLKAAMDKNGEILIEGQALCLASAKKASCTVLNRYDSPKLSLLCR
ncbi:hypothetical protein [Scytonema sp. NUACC26]|uniref:hypothetical protein n=1 Tax=Scytonema sp. NUACC26 TaxID=3140176 RepID=UPI0034DC270A